MNWEKLLRDFRENRCILLLGPRVASDGAVPLRELLAEHLAELLDDEGAEYDPAERRNLPYIAQRYTNGDRKRLVDMWDKVGDFYQTRTQTLPTVFEKLAELPVSFFVNTSPDELLHRALLAANKEPRLRHYNFRRPVPFGGQDLDIDLVSPQKPLVYNLLGSVADKESLVLTSSDQVTFVRKVLEKNPPLPDELLAKFSPFHTYIFLGFDLENWHFRLLLDALNLAGSTAFAPQADNYPMSTSTRAFYEEHFNFHFEDQRIEAFADEALTRLKGDGAARQKNVVVIAAHEDEEMLAGLERAMLPAEKNGDLALFHRARAPFGQNVDEVLKEKIAAADAVLALVSPDFFADDNLLDKDFEWAKEWQRQKPNGLIPVVARSCDWRANSELRKITPLPDDGLPVSLAANRDEALQRIVEQLKRRLA